LIFGHPLELTERENKYLKELRDYIKEKDLTIPPG
jgi:hypothetical protein